MDATFRAGGLASGMDTSAIIDQLVELESRPLDLLAKRKSAFQAQVSALGDIASRLGALQTAAKSLGDDGVLAATVASTNTGFSAAPGSGAVAGRYAVTVQELARASKWRSGAFASTDRVAGGTLSLRVQGVDLPAITIADGATLGEVADAIRGSGAAVSAVVLNDGTSSYLS
ncbi:MAG TPA: flagellar cap protein FliD N-terminal domain-containing protein, partial [Anaeromyxobacteraceae bacterium]|nr:flagellar cap protein FliD N-terminal domain-containing protein [Anaeromyxobacteraceae bacterium]